MLKLIVDRSIGWIDDLVGLITVNLYGEGLVVKF